MPTPVSTSDAGHEFDKPPVGRARRGASAVVCAPDAPQMHVVDHRSGQVEEGASRNVLVESVCIAPALVARVLGG